MAKILIDTNFFLNIIRNNNDAKIILDDLKSISNHLIFADQIIDEFNRNIEDGGDNTHLPLPRNSVG